MSYSSLKIGKKKQKVFDNLSHKKKESVSMSYQRSSFMKRKCDGFFTTMEKQRLALAFDDVRLKTDYSEVLPKDADLKTIFSRNVRLNMPIVSSPMDTVTEDTMAIAMAQLGGLGVVHKNLTIERQASMVQRVKHVLNAFIEDPVCIKADQTVKEVLEFVERKKYKFLSFPVLNTSGNVIGIVARSDFECCMDNTKKISAIMSKKIVSAEHGITIKAAYNTLMKNRIKILPVFLQNKFKGIYTLADVKRIVTGNSLDYNLAPDGTLRVGATIGVGQEAKKGGYPHFMLKEIMEHPESLENVLKGRLLVKEGTAKLGGLEALQDSLSDIDKIQIIACGGSFFAAKVGEYMSEEYAGLPTKVDVASEFRYKKSVFDKKTLYIFISQSGETADTLAALHEVKKNGGLTLGIVNVVGSSLAREVGAGIYTHSGPEVAVASTKTFTAQVTALILVTLFLARHRQLPIATGKKIVKELLQLPELARHILQGKSRIEKIAKKYQDFSHFFVIGRKYHYPIALEGALKLKEVAYVHGEGIEGGELKHGYLSLIEKNFPTIAICPSDGIYGKMLSNIQQIKARNGPVIAIATEGNEEIKKIANEVIYIPKALEIVLPILATIPLHLLAYYIASFRGCPIDQPRNLAKSVTVE